MFCKPSGADSLLVLGKCGSSSEHCCKLRCGRLGRVFNSFPPGSILVVIGLQCIMGRRESLSGNNVPASRFADSPDVARLRFKSFTCV